MYRTVLRLAVVGLACTALACNGDPAANPTAPDAGGLAGLAIAKKKPRPPDDPPPPVDPFDFQVDFSGGMTGSAIGITSEDYPENAVWISPDDNPPNWLDFSAIVAEIPGGSECFGNDLEHVSAYSGGGVTRFANQGDPSTWPYVVRYFFEALGKDNSTPVVYRVWLNGEAGQLGENEWVPAAGETVTLQFDSADISIYGGGKLKKLACQGGSDSFTTMVTVTNMGPH